MEYSSAGRALSEPDSKRSVPLRTGKMRICVCSGPHEGESRVLEQLSIVIGREPSMVDWALFMDRYISRRHLQVRLLEDRAIILKDLGSRNGTYVLTDDMKWLKLIPGEPVRVEPPVYVKIGNTVLTFSG